jgi:hypothetical protein
MLLSINDKKVPLILAPQQSNCCISVSIGENFKFSIATYDVCMLANDKYLRALLHNFAFSVISRLLSEGTSSNLLTQRPHWESNPQPSGVWCSSSTNFVAVYLETKISNVSNKDLTDQVRSLRSGVLKVCGWYRRAVYVGATFRYDFLSLFLPADGTVGRLCGLLS